MRDPSDPQEVLEFPPVLYLLAPSLDDRFEKYDRENPHIYEALERLALEWFHAGRNHCSVVTLYEKLRWDTGISGKGDPWKLNDNYRSRYARKILERNPELPKGFFELRRLPSRGGDDG